VAGVPSHSRGPERRAAVVERLVGAGGRIANPPQVNNLPHISTAGEPPMTSRPKLPKGAIKPRPAVQAMAPYSPPTGGRANKLRLDFNENTVGCSPAVIAALKQHL
jgi:hypothetical protein